MQKKMRQPRGRHVGRKKDKKLDYADLYIQF